MRRPTDPASWRAAIDLRLSEIASGFGKTSPALGMAMAEAALAPGKRFRATLLLMTGAATGRVCPALIDTAAAIELVHTGSLVFDDLPCMDNASLRRGRMTTHLAHGESRAILAGIALVTEALRVVATARDSTPTTRAALVATLAQAVGPSGLSGGQDLDLHAEKTPELIAREQDLKTGALFVAGFDMLAIIQNLSAENHSHLTHLGKHLGRAFQSYDDLLDVLATADETGKDTGRDTTNAHPARGILAVQSLSAARALYTAHRRTVATILARCQFETGALCDHISQVLPEMALHEA